MDVTAHELLAIIGAALAPRVAQCARRCDGLSLRERQAGRERLVEALRAMDLAPGGDVSFADRAANGLRYAYADASRRASLVTHGPDLKETQAPK